MPNEFERLAQYAAEHGYLRLTEAGGVALDTRRDDPFARRLGQMIRARQGGDLDEGAEHVGPGVIIDQFQRRARAARRAAARVAMERGWNNLGGPKSPIGLPINNQISLKELGLLGERGYSAEFRGGSLTLLPNGLRVETHKQMLVNINLVGLECQIRQEGTDEVYGVVSVLGPSSSTIVSRRVPDSGTIDMGPDGMRISQMNVPLVSRGVLQDYFVWATLVENDSGDVDVIARNITEKFATVAAAAVGALTGAPAEAVASSQSFKENMITGLAWVFGNILGMGDDPYSAESFVLNWPSLMFGDPPQKPTVRRNDDPRTIENWTHSLILSGIDDGGDRGQYAFYFRVWRTENTATESAPTSP